MVLCIVLPSLILLFFFFFHLTMRSGDLCILYTEATSFPYKLHGTTLNECNRVYFSILLLMISRQFQVLCRYKNAAVSTFVVALCAYV